MLLQYDNLKELDMKRNILTFPIVLNKTVWGILNIKEMPFEKYTRYSESIVQMIIRLAEPTLEQAFEYDTLLLTGDIDPQTQIPTFSQFSSELETTIESTRVREGNLSILLMELINIEKLTAAHGDGVMSIFLPELAGKLQESTHNKGQLFHYKEKHQLALIVPNIDYDGASLMCLDILEMINFTKWNIEGEQIAPETAIAFSALGEEAKSAEEMMKKVESIIQVQKA
jgi:GGDEF domain-containing protein